MRVEWPAFELAAIQAKNGREEPQNSTSRLWIPMNPPLRAVKSVISMPTARIAHVRASDDVAFDHLFCVLVDWSTWVFWIKVVGNVSRRRTRLPGLFYRHPV